MWPNADTVDNPTKIIFFRGGGGGPANRLGWRTLQHIIIRPHYYHKNRRSNFGVMGVRT